MKGYWWAEFDPASRAQDPYCWRPSLDTEDGTIFALEIWFESKAACEEWIEKYVIGRELRRD